MQGAVMSARRSVSGVARGRASKLRREFEEWAVIEWGSLLEVIGTQHESCRRSELFWEFTGFERMLFAAGEAAAAGDARMLADMALKYDWARK